MVTKQKKQEKRIARWLRIAEALKKLDPIFVGRKRRFLAKTLAR